MNICDYARVLCKLSVSLQGTLYMLHKKGTCGPSFYLAPVGWGWLCLLLAFSHGLEGTIAQLACGSSYQQCVKHCHSIFQWKSLSYWDKWCVCDCSQAIILIWCILFFSHLVTTNLLLNDDLCVGAPFLLCRCVIPKMLCLLPSSCPAAV